MDANRNQLRLFLFTALIAINVLSLNGCARPQARTSKTYFAPPPMMVPVSGQYQGFYHVVQRGQTLYRISKLYHVNVNEIMRANSIKSASSLEVGQKILIPQQRSFIPVSASGARSVSFEEARRIIGPKRNSYYWQTITVHHSGTYKGSARNFDRDHKRRKMGGLFYHFVIGNGTSTRDGEVEVGFRWKRQIKANRPYDVQICLVGNFDEQNVSEAQFMTLVNLIRVIQGQYGISTGQVRQHCDIPGKHTDCPGKKFPFSRLISELYNRPA